MTEHILFVISLAIIGIWAAFIIFSPARAIQVILKFYLPGYKLIKARKKAKKRVKEGEK